MEETIRQILEMAKKAAPVITSLTGTPYIGAAVTAGQAILELIDNIGETAGMSQEEIQTDRDALEAAVNAHVDETIANLRG
jgi:hypothetical protein